MDLNKISLFLISALSIFAVYCALTIGLSWDEAFHHLNGNFRADYVKSLGKLKNYNVESVVRFYPGLYDTIHFVIANLFPCDSRLRKYNQLSPHHNSFVFS